MTRRRVRRFLADEQRYFGHFATEAVFMGTDATDRWDVAAFRKYAHPHFAKGKAWSFRAVRRAVTVPNERFGEVMTLLDKAQRVPAVGAGAEP